MIDPKHHDRWRRVTARGEAHALVIPIGLHRALKSRREDIDAGKSIAVELGRAIHAGVRFPQLIHAAFLHLLSSNGSDLEITYFAGVVLDVLVNCPCHVEAGCSP